MIRLNNIQYANDITYIFLGYGIAQKLPAVFNDNKINDFNILPVQTALRQNLIPDYIKIPESVPISPGSPVETPIDKWVLISHIKYDSLEPYLRDIYMEDLYKSMGC